MYTIKQLLIAAGIIILFVIAYIEVRLYVYEAHALRTDVENLKADQSKIGAWINTVITNSKKDGQK